MNKSTNIEVSTDISLASIIEAQLRIKPINVRTPLQHNLRLSEGYQADVYIKREDLQIVRSYKIRGAFNKISLLADKSKPIVCASAGNHAQGVALSCEKLKVHGKIYMPITTPKQKIEKVKRFGKSFVEVEITGDTYDDSYHAAMRYAKETNAPFIHPFNDYEVIQGQGTVGLEILEDIDNSIDYLFVPIGGGGLIAGLVKVFSTLSPKTKIIGVEPLGAPSMKESIKKGEVIELQKIDTFVDGASVKKVGEIPFAIVKDYVHEILLVPEGKICTTILELYNQDAIVAEPAGALAITALDFYKKEIVGKRVVCILSGGNNDIARMEEMKERSMFYEGYKHYFTVTFPQRAGALKDFLEHVLGPDDDITYFQYIKKVNREKGPATIGLELKNPKDIELIMERLKERNFEFEHLNNDEMLFRMIV